MNWRDVLLALVLGLALYLTWASLEQKRLLKAVAENAVLQSELQRSKSQGGPCRENSSDVRTWEAKR